MKLVPIILLVYLLGCSSKHHEIPFPNLNINPLVEAYKLNGVKSYYGVVHGVDYRGEEFSIKSDSVNLNRQGLELSYFQLDDFLGATRRFYTYDSLNRLVSLKRRSCTYSDYIHTYEFDSKNHQVIQNWQLVLSKDTLLDIRRVFTLAPDNSKVLAEFDLDGLSDDTLNVVRYKYNENMLTSIEGRGERSVYKYNELGVLSSIEKVPLDEDEVQEDDKKSIEYVSTSTGLIDSTITAYGFVKHYRYSFWDEEQ